MSTKMQDYERLSKELNELEHINPEAAAKKARKIAQEARKNHDEAYSLFFEGEAYAFEGKNEKAEQLEKEAVTLLPDVPFLLSNYGVLLSRLGQHEEAIEYYDRALAKEPENVHALSSKGVAISDLGKHEEAIEYFDRALAKEPENVHALSHKGTALSKLGKNEEAIEYFDRALAKEPENVHALSHKGTALSHLGKHEEAVEYFEKSKTIEPWDDWALSWVSQIYLELGELEKAEESAQQLITALKEKKQSTRYGEDLLRRIQETGGKREAERPEVAEVSDSMQKVLQHFGPQNLQNFLNEVDEKEKEFSEFITSSGKSKKILMSKQENFLSVLRKWNSYTPIMTLDLEESKGGGYFLYMGEKGIVVDPGFDFIRNFFKETFKLIDIDYIFITHAHVDHLADLEALFSLFHKNNENKTEGNKNKIELFVNVGTMKKLSSWLDLEEDYIGRVHVLGTGQVVELDDLKVTCTHAKHDEALDKSYSLGFIFEHNDYRIGFTGDTGWEIDASIAEPFEDCQILVAHLGSVIRDEIGDKPIEERLYKNHLGLLGMSGLIGKVRPKLCIISEFGEELGDLRTEVAEGLSKALGIKCIAADVRTEISIPTDKREQPGVRCALCGNFKKDYTFQILQSTIVYYCQECTDQPKWVERLNDYIKGKRWELWDQS